MRFHYPEQIEQLIEYFRLLPGVGRRGAERMVMALLKRDPEELDSFGKLISTLPEKIASCPECGALATSGDSCMVCSDSQRDRGIVCVVENMPQLMAVESSGQFNGIYVVLGGKLDPLAAENGENLNLDILMDRAADPACREIILALSNDVEGRATAVFLAELLEKYPVKVTRPALGLPAGGNLSFVDAQTIAAALKGRS